MPLSIWRRPLGASLPNRNPPACGRSAGSCICGMTTLSGRFWQLWSTKEFFTKPCRTGLLTHHGKSWTVSASETAAAQARLTESVVEQAERLSGKIHYATLVPLGIAALICLLVFGSLMLWAGFCIGSGHSLPPAALLNMPSGILSGGLSFVAGIYLFVITARLFIDEDDAWKKSCAVMFLFVIVGIVLLMSVIY